MQEHSDVWIRYFREHGHAEVEPLAAGMEGAVYRVGNGSVAKVWKGKSRDGLLLLQRF